MEDVEFFGKALARLKRLGVRLTIDDFGTGYSSLGYLRRFPLDAVKIDRSFIEDVTEGTRQAALVHAIVELCRILELDTVAEGVETAEQALRLTELGCELAQGFHFGRPMPARELARRLASWDRHEPVVVASRIPTLAADRSARREATGAVGSRLGAHDMGTGGLATLPGQEPVEVVTTDGRARAGRGRPGNADPVLL
jgi:hypothetical protein